MNACKGKLKFRYDLVWDKKCPVGYFDANRRQLRQHENVLVFSIEGYPCYNAQMTKGKLYNIDRSKQEKPKVYGNIKNSTNTNNNGDRYPISIIRDMNNRSDSVHPTQKPVSLLEYLVATYSNESDLILDPFLGSGTTAVASRNLKRRYIGFELEEEYYDICVKRLNEPPQGRMF